MSVRASDIYEMTMILPMYLLPFLITGRLEHIFIPDSVSPLFWNILININHPNTLIYLKDRRMQKVKRAEGEIT